MLVFNDLADFLHQSTMGFTRIHKHRNPLKQGENLERRKKIFQKRITTTMYSRVIMGKLHRPQKVKGHSKDKTLENNMES